MIKFYKIRSCQKFGLMHTMLRELSKARHLLILSNYIDGYIDVLNNNPRVDHYILFENELEEVDIDTIVCPKERGAIFKYLMEND
jgi:hypothetical protein